MEILKSIGWALILSVGLIVIASAGSVAFDWLAATFGMPVTVFGMLGLVLFSFLVIIVHGVRTEDRGD